MQVFGRSEDVSSPESGVRSSRWLLDVGTGVWPGTLQGQGVH